MRDVTSLILVALIVLKLTGVITWSWWWVLSRERARFPGVLTGYGVASPSAPVWAGGRGIRTASTRPISVITPSMVRATA
jgi:hypothetical protein